MLAVRQHNECEEASSVPGCLLTAIRVQIPTDLSPAVAKLLLEVDGETSRSFLIRPVRDNAHVLTACDLVWDTNPGSTCGGIAFHSDETRVDEARPAVRGETIVIYAHGLGPTIPPVPAGTAAPQGAGLIVSAARQLELRFSVFRNASATLPRYFESEAPRTENTVVFAGLTPGQIGLYQINVTVPVWLDIPIACGGDTRSNVLVKVSTVRGVENLPICVAP